MELREFTSPEERDYDIKSSLNNLNNDPPVNPYSVQLFNLIGILEDVTDAELQEQYGISLAEYFHPTQETVDKVSERINGRHR